MSAKTHIINGDKMLKSITLLILSSGLMASQTSAGTNGAPVLSIIKDSDFKALGSGCYSQYWRSGASDSDGFFIEQATDTRAIGVLRLKDRAVKLRLETSTGTDKMTHRVFVDVHHDIRLQETIHFETQHPDSDSVELKGTITITLKGKSTKIAVLGATLC